MPLNWHTALEIEKKNRIDHCCIGAVQDDDDPSL